jgi:hypothetical protein
MAECCCQTEWLDVPRGHTGLNKFLQQTLRSVQLLWVGIDCSASDA